MKPDAKRHPFLENPQQELRAILIERKNKNKNYSARAFAKDLGLSAAFFSQVISGKRNLSLKQTLIIADRLTIDLTHVCNTAPPRTNKQHYRLVQNTIEHEKLIRYWYHFAILELCQVPGTSSKPSWIANRLGISELEAKDALLRLMHFDYVECGADHSLKRTQMPFIFDAKKTSVALRSHHQSRLKAAITELEDADNTAVDHRNMQTIFVATSRDRIQSAKAMINKFTQDLMKYLTEGPQEEVFQYSTQFFSAENKINNSKKENKK